MADKQRIEYNFLAPREDSSGGEGRADGMEVDNVKAMVHGVKTRGVGFLILVSLSLTRLFLLGQGSSQVCEKTIGLNEVYSRDYYISIPLFGNFITMTTKTRNCNMVNAENWSRD
jgi:hypothetical protein